MWGEVVGIAGLVALAVAASYAKEEEPPAPPRTLGSLELPPGGPPE